MATEEDPITPLQVTLCRHRGMDTSIFIDAEITEDGALLLSGQDVGRAPLEHWGDADYEYWVTVSAEHKERMLLLLMQQAYGVSPPRRVEGGQEGYRGDPAAVSAFLAFLDEHGVPRDARDWTDTWKDRVLLLLMRRAYGGNLSASSAFMDFLKAHGVPYTFDSWV